MIIVIVFIIIYDEFIVLVCKEIIRKKHLLSAGSSNPFPPLPYLYFFHLWF